MKKLTFLLIAVIILFGFIGCSKANKAQSSAPETIKQSESEKIDASEDVLLWAQYEIDNLVHMLTVDGFFKDENQSGSLITVDIKENEITNLELVKTLDFHNNTKIDLYQLDFRLLPENLKDQSLFTLDDSGWIASDDNFTYGDADGTEAQKGQLYLLIQNDAGTLTSMGIRRAETLTQEWCDNLLAYYNYPLGVNFNMSEDELQNLYDYWKWSRDWSFSMPCNNGYGDTWSVGLGYEHEWGLGISYQWIGTTEEQAQDMAAYLFSTVRHIYYEGLAVVVLDGFYGKGPDGMSFAVNQYLSTTQTDCETFRGIHAGDTLEALRAAYPEVYKNEDYEPVSDGQAGIAENDQCWVYAPETSNRSILFLIKDNIIVQIDMADGLDGQITSPVWLGEYKGQ